MTTENSMIERVARALCDDTLKRWRSPIGVKSEPWREFIPAARAAIEAMREPTYAMKFADDVKAWPEDATKVWQVMIDAAMELPDIEND